MERIALAVICPIYLEKLSLYFPDILFDVQTARERKSVRIYKKRHKETIPWPDWRLTSTDSNFQLTTFSKIANFYISNFRISLVWCHLTELLRHITPVPKFTFFISLIKPVTRHDSILFTFGLLVLVAVLFAWTCVLYKRS